MQRDPALVGHPALAKPDYSEKCYPWGLHFDAIPTRRGGKGSVTFVNHGSVLPGPAARCSVDSLWTAAELPLSAKKKHKIITDEDPNENHTLNPKA